MTRPSAGPQPSLSEAEGASLAPLRQSEGQHQGSPQCGQHPSRVEIHYFLELCIRFDPVAQRVVEDKSFAMVFESGSFVDLRKNVLRLMVRARIENPRV